MKRLAKLVTTRSKTVLYGFIALIALSTIFGIQSFGALKGGGYEDPTSDSARVTSLLSTEFKIDQPELVAILDFGRSADEPLSQTVATAFADRLKEYSAVEKIDSYYSSGKAASLKSIDGTAVYFFVNLDDKVNQAKVATEMQDEFGGGFNEASVYLAGMVAVTSELNAMISSDLALAETIALPIMLVLMIFVFGSLVAAGLPLMVGALSIVGSFFFVWVATLFTDTSVFSANLITGLGLGLGIDYALLMVNRFREERQAGSNVSEAVEKMVLTAGRTVLFSGMTVAIVLGSMAIFPQYFLKSMAYAGVAVVGLSLASALFALPAALNLLGDRVNKFTLYKGALEHQDEGIWADIARSVMQKPIRVLLVSVLALGSLVALGNGVQFGQVDDRILPRDNRVVAASNIIRERFEGREANPVEVLAKGASDDQVVEYAKALSADDSIKSVRTSEGYFENGEQIAPANPFDPTKYAAGDYRRIVAIHDVESRGTSGLELTDRLRAIDTAGIDQVLIGGGAAVYTDSQKGIEHNLPTVLLWIVLSTLVLLFLFTGSFIFRSRPCC